MIYNFTRLERTRVALRLPILMLENIDALAARTQNTRTGIIEAALTNLLRDLQHDVYAEEFLATLHDRSMTRTATRLVQLRLPKMLVDYLRINQYNVSACIKTAVNLYKLP